MPYPQVILNPKREKSVLNRHPWLFSGAIKKMPKAESGAIVEVLSIDNQLLGYAFFSNESQISCRLFEFSSVPKVIDENYWLTKFENAWSTRTNFINLENTNGFRLIHAEGDFCPGLIVDVYGNTAVAQILIAGTLPLIPILEKFLLLKGIQNLYNKSDTKILDKEKIETSVGWLKGDSHEVIFKENNLLFKSDPEKGQKTGFFIDQRDNRLLVQNVSKNKNVLNTFAYSGGFSLFALEGGANQVVSLDSSARAAAICEENLALNPNLDINKHSFVIEDCFNYLRLIEQDFFDIIILDPPAFAKHKSAVANAYRGYKEINLYAMKKIKKGGLLFTFSCSQAISPELFQKILFDAASDAQRNVRILQFLHQSPDHPVNIFHPEGEYLKGFLLSVD